MMDNIKLDIPTSWDDITIGQFVELQPVLKSDMGLIKKVNSVLSVLTGNPVDDLENVAASENNIRAYRDISNTLSFMNDYTNMGEVVSTFKLKGKRYALNLDIEAMDAGQYISLMDILKKANSNPEETINYTHEILACLIHEIKGPRFKRRAVYDELNYRDTCNLFWNELPISTAYPLTVFFCKVWEDCTKSLHESLLNQSTEIMEEVKKDLAMHGAGT